MLALRTTVVALAAGVSSIVAVSGASADENGPAADSPDLVSAVSVDLTTWPAFDPLATDYGIVCANSTEQVTVIVDADDDATILVNGRQVENASPTEVPVRVHELIEVDVTSGADRAEYFLRCLPEDFPRMEVERPGSPEPGWYTSTFGQGPSPSGNYMVIFDEYGAPVWYADSEVDVLNFDRRPDGSLRATKLSSMGFGTIDDAVRTRLFDLGGAPVGAGVVEITAGLGGLPYPEWEQDYPIDHHEHVDHPDGGSTILSYPLRDDGLDLTPLEGLVTCPTGDTPPCFNDDEWIVDNALIELDADGEIQWIWHAMDHFGVLDVAFPQRFARYADAPNGGEIDVIHTNSVQRLGNGDYIASARHIDAAYRVDRATGELAWVLGSTPPAGGSPTANERRLDVLNDPYNGVIRPHDARFDESTNTLTIFDNRSATADPARVAAYRIDEANMTATLLWQLQEPEQRPSGAQGGTRVAPDGSVLVTWGTLQPVFQEYGPADANGTRELLLSIAQVPSGISYRIIKHAPEAFDRQTLRDTAGVSIPPLP
ncbi:MAG: aryl-sulfate sulfotransferase [Actinomycetota bacterium]